MPVQRPAASGPASVWVMAQTFEVNIPSAMHASVIRTTEAFAVFTKGAGAMAPAQRIRPPAEYSLRTFPGSAPARIHRSDVHPPTREETAIAQNGTDPRSAMLVMDSPRSETR